MLRRCTVAALFAAGVLAMPLSVASLSISSTPALAQGTGKESPRARADGPPNPPPKTRGAPGPVVGVGLPLLVLLGGGAYWVMRRRSRKVG
jgi:hypothetical protein